MQFGGQTLAFHLPTKSRIPWIAAAVCCMFGSSYSIDRLLGIAGFVSAWTGTPQYAERIRQLNERAPWWAVSAVGFILLATLLLGLGIQTKADEALLATDTTLASFCRPEELIPAVLRFVGRLVISILGTIGFVLARSLISYF
jgi:hypothetical protein